MVLKCFFQSLISFFCCKTFVGQNHLSFTVINFQNFCFHLIIHMYYFMEVYALVIGIFAFRNDTVCFVPYIQDDFVIFHIDNCTFDYLSIMNCFE